MTKRSIHVRFLRVDDVPALARLEARQWEPHQAADEATLRERIAAFPDLGVGAFCARSGEALASLFMRPTTERAIRQSRCWSACAQGHGVPDRRADCDALFGISLTSVDAAAVGSVVSFFWPHALKGGWRAIYLGSPMPGFAPARAADAQLDAERYARAVRGGLPRDPQLRYYYQRGFTQIVTVRPDYFPHAGSLDHAAVLRGRVPLSWLSALWRRLPLPWICALLGGAPRAPSRIAGVRPAAPAAPAASIEPLAPLAPLAAIGAPAGTAPRELRLWWNGGDAWRTRLFDAMSLILPSGEQFVIETASAAMHAKDLPAPLRAEVLRFIEEEKGHQRAHRSDLVRLATESPVEPLERGIAEAVGGLRRYSLPTRVAFAAAFEVITGLMSREVLRSRSAWLCEGSKPQQAMWRWHCGEEIAHGHVAVDLMHALHVGPLRRAAVFLTAAALLVSDVVVLVGSLCRHDRRCGRLPYHRVLSQAAAFAWRSAPGWARMASGGLSYAVTGRAPAPTPGAVAEAS